MINILIRRVVGLEKASKREKEGGWMAGSPPSHVSARGRVVGLEKALRRVETREEGCVRGRKPLRLTF